MKRNRIIIDITIIIFAFVIFIIWHQNSNAAQMTFSNIKYYKVYLITTDKGLQYWGILNKGAADMAAAVGVNYSWEAPDVRDPEQQIELINQAVNAGADALLVATDEPKRISAAIEDAKARGVKVIYVDSPAYEEAITTLSTDNYEAGAMAGQYMISTLEEKGINSGSIGIVNLANKENTAIREQGFRETLAKDPRFKVLETIYTKTDKPEETQQAAERIISQNPDLVGLFGTSEGTTIGVGNANKVNDNKYAAIGFDKTEINLELLREGSLSVIIDQNPYSMGYLGMAEAIAAILGKDTGPDYINTGVSVVEKR